MALTVPPLLRQGFAQSKDALVAAAGFSLALNVLTLAMPIRRRGFAGLPDRTRR
jgi:hypothetical protein